MKKLPRTKCLMCENICKRATTKCCSPSCNLKYLRSQGVRMGGPVCYSNEPRECATCHQVFVPNDYKKEQKYCNAKCTGQAHIEQCRELGHRMKGKKFSDEARANMSKAACNRPARENYTKGIGGTREDIGRYVRSSWEANIARILIYEKIDYEFEPQIFRLENGPRAIHYIPDFKLQDRFIEVKGWWNEKSLLVKRLMAEQHPEIKIEYISEPEYLQLQLQYKEIINGWETKRQSRK